MANIEKRNLILQVGLNFFAEKGFENTKISEIANNAGISEATLYGYFQGKEDLLFNIPVEKTKIMVENLKEHFLGISGAENKLRKIIWYYLNFFESNKDYATLILFELRPNRNFYQSGAYQSFREFNKIFVDILKEGQETGIFQKNVNIFLYRNLVFGAIDHTLYGWLIFGKPKSLLEQAEGLFSLFYSIIRSASKDNKVRKKEEEEELRFDKKTIILKVATKVFAEKGFEKANISDISKDAGLGDATLYEYFQNKEDILFNVPVERSEFLVRSLNAYLDRKYEAESKLRRYVWHYLSFLQNNKDYVTILLFELRPNRRFYSCSAYQLFRKYNNILINILNQGQEENIFRKDVNIYLMRNLIYGAIDHTALTWLLFEKPPNLLDQGEAIINLFMRAIESPEDI